MAEQGLIGCRVKLPSKVAEENLIGKNEVAEQVTEQGTREDLIGLVKYPNKLPRKVDRWLVADRCRGKQGWSLMLVADRCRGKQGCSDGAREAAE